MIRLNAYIRTCIGCYRDQITLIIIVIFHHLFVTPAVHQVVESPWPP